VEAVDMVDVGNATKPIAFGDFRQHYTVVDRIDMQVQRDDVTQAATGRRPVLVPAPGGWAGGQRRGHGSASPPDDGRSLTMLRDLLHTSTAPGHQPGLRRGRHTPLSQIIDMQGYSTCLFVGALGAIADADATFAVLVEDGATPASPAPRWPMAT
jgi:hypothetical protein